MLDPRLLAVIAAHLAYSLALYLGLGSDRLAADSAAKYATWIDVLFGAAIAILTEGAGSPAFPFFAFAVVAAGLRAGLHKALLITGVSVTLYLGFILISTGKGADAYIMRPVYLAITGYLVGFLGEQRRELQQEVADLDRAEQRHRIARDLHDGFAQALAGINLRLESCRRSMRVHAAGDVLDDLTELQDSVKREYDDLRNYTRSLVGLDATTTSGYEPAATVLSFHAELSGSLHFVDHVLQIAREGINNIRKHARARTASIRIGTDDTNVRVSIADDGVGYRSDVTPWSISSRVSEIGGRLQITSNPGQGARLLITLPHT
ncbi:MAG TPA: histidine kinase [Candidatus Kryptonia bacterium]|nr:histidine kinase [Candidatus Kryptonia bacterium]